MDFVAEDQDETRRFSGIQEALNPDQALLRLSDDLDNALMDLPALLTDYWENERYYLMVCVEKGDIKKLFEPVCRDYHVPIISSKGWPPLNTRSDIAKLAKKAEERGLTAVLLLFYDHDPVGMVIPATFRKLFKDMMRGTGWDPKKPIIERFGLNKVDIELYRLPWVPNLKTSSGKESMDKDYIARFGRNKCECNALFRNEESLRAGAEICRKAIEKFMGEAVLERFNAKEIKTREKLSEVLDNPIWETFKSKIDSLADSLGRRDLEENHFPVEEPEKIFTLDYSEKYYPVCPRCGTVFDDSDLTPGITCRCKIRNAQIIIIKP